MQIFSTITGPRYFERKLCGIRFASMILTLLSSTVLLLPAMAVADDEEKADTLENHGIALYQKELYDEAVRAFRQLLKIRPNQQVYFNIGQCEFMRQRFDLALEAFSVYLSGDREKMAKKRLEYTEKVVEEITSLVGALDIRGESPLEVWIDDELRGSTPLSSPLYVLEGEHRLAFKKDGEIVQTETYAVKPGETIPIQVPDVALEPEPTPEPVQAGPVVAEPVAPEIPATTTAAPVAAEEEPERAYLSPLKPLGIALLGVGGAMLVAGTVTGGLSHKKSNQLGRNCPDRDQCAISNKELKESGQSLQLTSNGLFAAGLALTTAGVVLTIVGHRKSKVGEALSASPIINETTAGMTVSGRF